jgi:hypothetical protein
MTISVGYIMRNSIGGLEIIQQGLEYAISTTPTGEMRNKLADANIHLALAIRDCEAAHAMFLEAEKKKT